jgi:cytochrome c
MRTSERRHGTARRLALVSGLVLASAAAHAQTRLGIGHLATPAQIAGWDIDVAPDGRNLPPGSATVAQGRAVYVAQCAACHGDRGQGGVGDRLSGGQGTLATDAPVRTVGSYWPYATTLFDYIRRAMPLNAPQSLSAEQVYAVAGYVLFLNGIVPPDALIDARTLTALRMPNRDGFIEDPRPDVRDAGCVRECAR